MFKLQPANGEGRVTVVFSLEASPGRSAAVAGSFNDWDPSVTPMRYDPAERVYKAVMVLEPGEYEYKFVVDGEWRIDEDNPCLAPNDLGTLNSVLKVEAK